MSAGPTDGKGLRICWSRDIGWPTLSGRVILTREDISTRLNKYTGCYQIESQVFCMYLYRYESDAMHSALGEAQE